MRRSVRNHRSGRSTVDRVTDEQRPYGGGRGAIRRSRRCAPATSSGPRRQGSRSPGSPATTTCRRAIFDEAGIDFLLVGDSAGNTVFGYDTTIPVTVDELIPLTAAVVTRRAAGRSSSPTCRSARTRTVPTRRSHTAIRFMKETGCHAVKLEGGVRSAKQIKRIVRAGIPVMAHIGFTPQSEHGLGGHIIQGRGDGAQALLDDAHAVEEAGAFAVVLEMVPSEIAGKVTARALDPDDLGRRRPALRRPAARVERLGRVHAWPHPEVRRAVRQHRPDPARRGRSRYREDVESGVYPAERHEYSP